MILVLATVTAGWQSRHWVSDQVMTWIDLTEEYGALHVRSHRESVVEKIAPAKTAEARKTLSDDYTSAANEFWTGAADLAYYLSALATILGVIVTVTVVGFTLRQVGIAAEQVKLTRKSMHEAAHREQMRTLIDLDFKLIEHPELGAAIEGATKIDQETLFRARSRAFGYAFLNACDTAFDYYLYIETDPDVDSDTHWGAWEAQLTYHLEHLPELRAIAKQSLARNFFTKKFQATLAEMVENAEAAAKHQQRAPLMPKIMEFEPETIPFSSAPVLLRELDRDDAGALEDFYNSVYVREFPDEDERESLKNMLRYLCDLKPSGWYGSNNYHIAIAEQDGRRVGLCVSDYLAEANAGIIEFLVVAREERGLGVGRRLLEFTETLIAGDAARVHRAPPIGICAEMNDPFRIALHADNHDPFDRAAIWDNWGFRRLHMLYVQPALSPEQKPVEHLMLLAKPLARSVDRWPSETVLALLRGYLIYAMRIETPENDPQFAAMARHLAAFQDVRLRPLAAYVGRKPSLSWRDIRNRHEPQFNNAMARYTDAFKHDPEAMLAEEGFAYYLEQRRQADLRHSYHFWVVPEPLGDDVLVFASFFTLPHAGFGGYVLGRDGMQAKNGPALSKEVAIATVEERMRRDNPTIDGWFIECDPKAEIVPVPYFYRHGFREVALDYRQPPLPGGPYSFDESPTLHLLYKPFGARFGTPELRTADFLAAIEEIFNVVYFIDKPTRSPYYFHLLKQINALGQDTVPFHTEPPRVAELSMSAQATRRRRRQRLIAEASRSK